MHITRCLSGAVLALGVVLGGSTAAVAAAPAHPGPQSRPRADAVTVPLQDLQHFSHLHNAARHDVRTANQTSSNWAGYAANGGQFTAVTSSWVQPSVSCTTNGIAAFWIGLDGWGSNSVEQDGSGVDCSSGYPQYFAWWETYPANAVQEYGDPVAAGDSFTSTVTSRGGGQYDLVLTDNTRGWTENNVVAAPSGASNASAEVVAEAVTSGSSVTSLPDFGSVRFTGSTMNGGSLQAANAQAIDMTAGSGGSVIASTGPYDGAGDFTVSYGSGGGGGGGGTPPPTSCNGVPAWSASTSYAPGDVVSYNGEEWTATWYSTGAAPDAPASWSVWKDDGAC